MGRVYNHMKYICKWCGVEFFRQRSKRIRYCSRKCYDLSRQLRTMTVCQQCGIEFEGQIADNRKFCSRECANAFRAVPNKISICQQCGKEFETRSCIYHDYCSIECANTSRRTERVEITCLNCGMVFEARIDDGRKFCSNKCVGEYHTGTKHHGYNLQDRIRTCEYCGNEFEVDCVSNTKQYCSRECMGKAKIGENHPMWKGDECLFVCENCGIEYRDDSIRRQNNRNFCSMECRNTFMVGENHPCWRGGLTFIEYPQEFSEKLKELIRIRDNRVCQMCLTPEHELERKLHIHHIDWDKFNTTPSNLISLCVSCHGKTHTRENLTRDHLSKLANINTKENMQCLGK